MRFGALFRKRDETFRNGGNGILAAGHEGDDRSATCTDSGDSAQDLISVWLILFHPFSVSSDYTAP